MGIIVQLAIFLLHACWILDMHCTWKKRGWGVKINISKHMVKLDDKTCSVHVHVILYQAILICYNLVMLT